MEGMKPWELALLLLGVASLAGGVVLILYAALS